MDRDILLFEYLTRQLKDNGVKNPEEVAQDLIIDNHKNLWEYHGLAWQLGDLNFEFFCKYFLQDTFVPKENNSARELAPVHLEIWGELQKMINDDKYDKEEFILPRGCSKSTIINKALSCWLHCYKKSIYTIVIGNKDQDAVQFIADTKQMLKNQYIVDAFGKLIDTQNRTVNKQEIELINDTKIQAYGWGSSVRGTTYNTHRPSVIISDDIQDEDDILSEQAKQKVLNKWYKEVAEAGDSAVYRGKKKIRSATKFIVIGTPLAPDCYINTVRLDPTYKVFHRKVVDFDVDDYFATNKWWLGYRDILMSDQLTKEEKEEILKEYYEINKKHMEFETIWEKYECPKLAEKFYTKRTEFMQELMCDCENIGVKWIKSIRKQSSDEIEEHTFNKTMLTVDVASTTSRKADYTAFCVGSECVNGFTYIRKGVLAKLSFNEYCQRVVDIIKVYTDISHVYIEKNTYQGADVIKIKELIEKTPELKSRKIVFINEMQRRNKDDKISSIIDDVNCGNVIFNEEDEDFIYQIMEFSGQNYTLHDDAIDALAELLLRIPQIDVLQKVKILDKNLFF